MFYVKFMSYTKISFNWDTQQKFVERHGKRKNVFTHQEFRKVDNSGHSTLEIKKVSYMKNSF